MAKVTTVTLSTKEGTKKEFPVGEAEYLLRMNRSGWSLPADSDYEYKDGTITRKDKEKGK